MTKQQTLDHVARQGAAIDVDQRTGTAAALVDVFGKELLSRARGPHDQNGEPGPGVSLREHERAPNAGRAADDHGPIPFGSRGAVTLSASASVLMIRGVKNRYSSVSVFRRSELPNSPPMIGMPRSEERRVGKEWRCRWSREHEKERVDRE